VKCKEQESCPANIKMPREVGKGTFRRTGKESRVAEAPRTGMSGTADVTTSVNPHLAMFPLVQPPDRSSAVEKTVAPCLITGRGTSSGEVGRSVSVSRGEPEGNSKERTRNHGNQELS
jgi:hypothetical protein